jgi:hypothetical protein
VALLQAEKKVYSQKVLTNKAKKEGLVLPKNTGKTTPLVCSAKK